MMPSTKYNDKAINFLFSERENMASQKKTGIFSSIITALSIWILSPIMGKYFDTYEVFDVDNGDTIRVLNQFNKLIKIKLFKIKGHKSAQNDLAKKILGKNISLNIIGKDSNECSLGIITYDKRNINLEMVKEGLAHNDSKDYEFINAEKEAQRKRLGLWKTSKISKNNIYNFDDN